ncbi:uncharacterized protein LOC126209812 [Schistocerca nitens]|uniref:uncharacterized protein LOC126209812 n=1 Tax=Schistocerca nitens TaxID=7011 RepID=UPI00211846B1|nr:uncharacterized protein LOC126209812 [Schistocerca nitens]
MWWYEFPSDSMAGTVELYVNHKYERNSAAEECKGPPSRSQAIALHFSPPKPTSESKLPTKMRSPVGFKSACQKNVKNTIKRKPVEVRQTTASRLRMEKANPLLTIGKCTGLTSTFKVRTPASSLVRSTNIARKPFTTTTAAAPKQLYKVPRCNEKKINNEKKYTGPVQQKSSVQTLKKNSQCI